MLGPVDRVDVRVERAGQPGVLALVHGEQAERGDELGEVVGGRGDHQQGAAGGEHPGGLGAVARGEDVEHQAGGAGAHRQRAPGVGDHGAGPRVGAGGAAGGVPGQVQRDPDPVRPRVEHRGQVVPGPGADVEHRARAGGGRAAAASSRLSGA